MSARLPAQRSEPVSGRLELLGFVVRSVAPNEVRMSRSGSWVPLDFAGVLQHLERERPRDAHVDGVDVTAA